MRIALLIYLLIFIGHDALACSCKEYSLGEYYTSHDVVVIGRVKSFSEQSWWERLFVGGYSKVKSVIEVSTIYKGPDIDDLVIYTSDSSAACGFPFEEGVEYAIFARLEKSGDYEGKLLVNSCNPTIHTQSRDDYYEPQRKRVMSYLSSKIARKK